MPNYTDTLEGMIADAGPYDLLSTQAAIWTCERSQRVSRSDAARLLGMLLDRVLVIAETKWRPVADKPEPAKQRTLF